MDESEEVTTVPNEYDNRKAEEISTSIAREDGKVKQQESELQRNASQISNKERWYAADDGSFFLTRRDPFFTFNFAAYIFSMCVFTYLTVAITKDFIRQRKDPPTSTKLQHNNSQPFPGMIFCNHDRNVELHLLEAYLGNGTDDIYYDILGEAERVACGGTQLNCIKLNTNLPAFNYVSDGNYKCLGGNRIDLIFDISANSSKTSFLLGIDGFLHLPDADITNEEICATILSGGGCGKSFSTAAFFDQCGFDEGIKAYDKFMISSNNGNLVSLSRSSIPLSPPCNQDVVSWNPITTGVSYNQRLLKSEGIETESLVFVEFHFNSPVVSITKYNPQSGQSMFGRYVIVLF